MDFYFYRIFNTYQTINGKNLKLASATTIGHNKCDHRKSLVISDYGSIIKASKIKDAILLYWRIIVDLRHPEIYKLPVVEYILGNKELFRFCVKNAFVSLLPEVRIVYSTRFSSFPRNVYYREFRYKKLNVLQLLLLWCRRTELKHIYRQPYLSNIDFQSYIIRKYLRYKRSGRDKLNSVKVKWHLPFPEWSVGFMDRHESPRLSEMRYKADYLYFGTIKDTANCLAINSKELYSRFFELKRYLKQKNLRVTPKAFRFLYAMSLRERFDRWVWMPASFHPGNIKKYRLANRLFRKKTAYGSIIIPMYKEHVEQYMHRLIRCVQITKKPGWFTSFENIGPSEFKRYFEHTKISSPIDGRIKQIEYLVPQYEKRMNKKYKFSNWVLRKLIQVEESLYYKRYSIKKRKQKLIIVRNKLYRLKNEISVKNLTNRLSIRLIKWYKKSILKSRSIKIFKKRLLEKQLSPDLANSLTRRLIKRRIARFINWITPRVKKHVRKHYYSRLRFTSKPRFSVSPYRSYRYITTASTEAAFNLLRKNIRIGRMMVIENASEVREVIIPPSFTIIPKIGSFVRQSQPLVEEYNFPSLTEKYFPSWAKFYTGVLYSIKEGTRSDPMMEFTPENDSDRSRLFPKHRSTERKYFSTKKRCIVFETKEYGLVKLIIPANLPLHNKVKVGSFIKKNSPLLKKAVEFFPKKCSPVICKVIEIYAEVNGAYYRVEDLLKEYEKQVILWHTYGFPILFTRKHRIDIPAWAEIFVEHTERVLVDKPVAKLNGKFIGKTKMTGRVSDIRILPKNRKKRGMFMKFLSVFFNIPEEGISKYNIGEFLKDYNKVVIFEEDHSRRLFRREFNKGECLCFCIGDEIKSGDDLVTNRYSTKWPSPYQGVIKGIYYINLWKHLEYICPIDKTNEFMQGFAKIFILTNYFWAFRWRFWIIPTIYRDSTSYSVEFSKNGRILADTRDNSIFKKNKTYYVGYDYKQYFPSPIDGYVKNIYFFDDSGNYSRFTEEIVESKIKSPGVQYLTDTRLKGINGTLRNCERIIVIRSDDGKDSAVVRVPKNVKLNVTQNSLVKVNESLTKHHSHPFSYVKVNESFTNHRSHPFSSYKKKHTKDPRYIELLAERYLSLLPLNRLNVCFYCRYPIDYHIEPDHYFRAQYRSHANYDNDRLTKLENIRYIINFLTKSKLKGKCRTLVLAHAEYVNTHQNHESWYKRLFWLVKRWAYKQRTIVDLIKKIFRPPRRPKERLTPFISGYHFDVVRADLDPYIFESIIKKNGKYKAKVTIIKIPPKIAVKYKGFSVSNEWRERYSTGLWNNRRYYNINNLDEKRIIPMYMVWDPIRKWKSESDIDRFDSLKLEHYRSNDNFIQDDFLYNNKTQYKLLEKNDSFKPKLTQHEKGIRNFYSNYVNVKFYGKPVFSKRFNKFLFESSRLLSMNFLFKKTNEYDFLISNYYNEDSNNLPSYTFNKEGKYIYKLLGTNKRPFYIKEKSIHEIKKRKYRGYWPPRMDHEDRHMALGWGAHKYKFSMYPYHNRKEKPWGKWVLDLFGASGTYFTMLYGPPKVKPKGEYFGRNWFRSYQRSRVLFSRNGIRKVRIKNNKVYYPYPKINNYGNITHNYPYPQKNSFGSFKFPCPYFNKKNNRIEFEEKNYNWCLFHPWFYPETENSDLMTPQEYWKKQHDWIKKYLGEI